MLRGIQLAVAWIEVCEVDLNHRNSMKVRQKSQDEIFERDA
jgi:hypothetical protein